MTIKNSEKTVKELEEEIAKEMRSLFGRVSEAQQNVELEWINEEEDCEDMGNEMLLAADEAKHLSKLLFSLTDKRRKEQ